MIKLRNCVALFACIFTAVLLLGCAEQKADKEYTRISVKETAGGEPKPLVDEYQSLINKYPGTKAAAQAQERLAVLTAKLEKEAKEVAAEKEYTQVFEKETAGGQLKPLIDLYQAITNKYPETKAVFRAQERLTALKLKLEEEQKQQTADKEYTSILDKELAGGDTPSLIEQYQAFLTRYGETKAATSARERLLALRGKVEQQEKAKLGAQQQQETFEAERKRQLDVLRSALVQAAKKKVLVLYPNYNVIEVVAYKDETVKKGEDGKSFSVEQAYRVSLLGNLIGVNKKSVLLECAGATRFNDYSKQFEAPSITKCEAVAGQ